MKIDALFSNLKFLLRAEPLAGVGLKAFTIQLLALCCFCSGIIAEERLLALRYGQTKYPERQIFKDGRTGVSRDFAWLAYLYQNSETSVLIDTGCGPKTCKKSWGLGTAKRVSDLLRSVSVPPSSVKHVLLTHAHLDHAGDINPYVNAKAHMSRATLGRIQANNLLKSQYRDRKIVSFESGHAVLPNLKMLAVGGHTRDSSVVELKLGERVYLFPGDNCYVTENCTKARPVGSCEDRKAHEAFLERFGRGDYVYLPHHDLSNEYPEVSPNVFQIFPYSAQGLLDEASESQN